MLVILLVLNWMFSIIFSLLNHPLSLGSILLVQTILISLISGLIYWNFWFSYVLFLVMIGGMLVMFVYMTSVASNEMFKSSKIIMFFMACTLAISSFYYFTSFDSFYNMMNTKNMMMSTYMNNIINLSLSKFYSFPSMQLMIFLMIYLLISLIAVVKISSEMKGPLRQMM